MGERQSEFGREHPIVLLVYLLGGMLVTMLTMHPLLLCLSFLTATVYAHYLLGRVMWKRLFWLMLPVLLFTVIILPLFSHNGVTPLFYLNDMAVTWETVFYGLNMSILLLGIFQWCQIANRVLDSEKIMYLCGRGLPSVGLLISMIFRLLPLMGERFRQIRDGQKGMGRHGHQLSWIGRGRLLLKELSILVSWSLEESIETSISMESRGYGTGRRTSFDLFHLSIRSGVWCLLLLVLYGITLWSVGTNHFVATYFPVIYFSGIGKVGWVGLISFLSAAMAPLFYEMVKGRKSICGIRTLQ